MQNSEFKEFEPRLNDYEQVRNIRTLKIAHGVANIELGMPPSEGQAQPTASPDVPSQWFNGTYTGPDHFQDAA